MILSEKEIREYCKKKTAPLISPFSEDSLQGASYDVSMSGKIAVLKGIGRAIDPSNDRDLHIMYENRTIENNEYLLSPGEYVLVELNEKVVIPENLVAHIRPRTRFTRSGIVVADQHCNPTYEGVLYIGLFNAGVNPFILRPGLHIAQIVFEEISSVPSEDKLYKNKKNAAYEKEKQFRGAVMGEAGWTDDLAKTYEDIKRSLNGGD